MGKEWVVKNLPVLSMIGLQFLYAGMSLATKATFDAGFSPIIFLVYRQASASLLLTPVSIMAIRRRSSSELALGKKGFFLVFMAALIGATMNMSFYYKGLELSSATLATTMSNIIPAVTFLMAATVGMERVEIGSVRSMAKVLGTMVCVCGAFMMAFLKGKKLLNSSSSSSSEFGRMIWSSVLEATGDHNWLMGFFFLLGSSTCWSTWLILQVVHEHSWKTSPCSHPRTRRKFHVAISRSDWELSRSFDLYILDLVFFGLSASAMLERSVGFQSRCVVAVMRDLGVEKYVVAGMSYGGFVAFRLAAEAVERVPICKNHLDPLSLSTWMSVLSSLQGVVLALVVEPDWRAWRIESGFSLLSCLYTGLGSAISYFVQSWCISIRGPLFSAMFSPLCTVITSVFASILLNEQLYAGSLAGAAAIIGGLYIVLWGKASDIYAGKENSVADAIKITVSEQKSQKIAENNLQEPLIISLNEQC
ncbi:WAT1-related protein [Platanthera guangdongensis]|uniref:WAT1-related protein n=1 Tax=Platanthera guangdongensis TaxID=2320717 RepID=A0ABR2MER2_9ASPA